MTFEIDYTLAAPLTLRASFTVRGFTALLGRSGAGKTSLLKALAGLLPAAGTPEVRPVGYLPQETLLFPHLTVLENAAFALRGRHRLEQAGTLLAELGLADLAPRYPHQISGGQAKRVALARALGAGPKLLLLDEPSAGLDAVTRDATLDWLAEVTAARNLPVLAATHDSAIAQRAEWLALLEGGRIIQEGKARAVFAAPVSAEAASLLGYENVFSLSGRMFAIRAEDIGLADEGLESTVRAARETGGGLWLECGPEPRLSVHLTEGEAEDFRPGKRVMLHLPDGKLKRLG